MILTFTEMRDIILMSLFVGYILKDIFKFRTKTSRVYEPLEEYKQHDLSGLKLAIIVTAPAIILHEFGHKFLAIAFGMQAEFHAAYTWLIVGLILKMLNTGIIFFVPAYISITGGANVTALQYSLVAFAGPVVNLILWLGTRYYIKHFKTKEKYLPALVFTSRINMLLFIFNMLPIPGFDGWKVYSGIIQTIAALF
ncbi:hypothetical protein KY330_02900 [Candidatus Woesearchaeota archaeon]|nr:hypothetical protein [Candidatus Woesearchaeota archaeon]